MMDNLKMGGLIMKRSLKNLKGYTIEAIDGPKGKVKDFLFDEDLWVIRYVEVDFGNIWNDRRVLIPRDYLGIPDWDDKHFPVSLNRSQIEKCPRLDEKMTVSREYEMEMSRHYNLDYYWPSGYVAHAGAPMYYPGRPLNPPSRIFHEDQLDTSLRSFNEVRGYKIRATDGKLGQVEDFLIDDLDWQIVYLIIDTRKWMPWSRDVILSIDMLNSISYMDQEVTIDLESDQIREAPEYDPSNPFDMDYERALREYYQEILELK
ncbi:MAG: PRC-barrel domain containing protein [Bacteroidetes bacterium]|nr:MAG: PRC-barrel domain containing protein [Bacteroidota bacterium]